MRQPVAFQLEQRDSRGPGLIEKEETRDGVLNLTFPPGDKETTVHASSGHLGLSLCRSHRSYRNDGERLGKEEERPGPLHL